MRSGVVSAVEAVVPECPVAVALGGGADSAVAAWGLVTSGRATRALFVDHGLSGGLLADAAAAIAGRLQIDLAVSEGALQDGPDLEDRARRIRRRAFAAALGSDEALVTGHTATDQAETVLMNLMRGAGSRGVSAMSAQGAIYRPLLGFLRQDVRAFAVELELPFVDDPANDDPRFLRNRVRAEVLPALESIRPGAVAGLARSARLVAEDDRALTAAAAAVPISLGAGATVVAIGDLEGAPPAVVARVVRRLLDVGEGGQARFTDVRAVGAIVAGEGTRAQLSGNRFVEREGASITIWSTEPTPPPSVELTVPGRVRFGDHGLEIAIDSPGEAFADSDVLLDRAAVPARVIVRAALPGDRIAIAGGSKLVRDALAESGVPRRLRAAWPVVVADAKIAAIPAIRVAVWAAAGSGDVLRLRDERAVT